MDVHEGRYLRRYVISSMPQCRCEDLPAQQRCVDDNLAMERTLKKRKRKEIKESNAEI